MTRFGVAGLAGALLSLGACTSQVVQKEDMLAAAGFSFRPASSPRTATALKALPAHHFVHQMRDGQIVWIYADPTICGCLYVGNDAAYQRYRQEVFQKQIADQQTQAALMNQDAAMESGAMMDWGAWGPWAPYYYGP